METVDPLWRPLTGASRKKKKKIFHFHYLNPIWVPPDDSIFNLYFFGFLLGLPFHLGTGIHCFLSKDEIYNLDNMYRH